jgi:signal transduction histidine kinase
MNFWDIPEPIDEDLSKFSSPSNLRMRSIWFVQLRWIAIAITLCTLFIANELNFVLPYIKIFYSILFLSICNGSYLIYNTKISLSNRKGELNLIKFQMVMDLIILTIMIHYSGGIENPIFFIYIIHVIIASLIFKGKQVYQIAFVAILLYTLEVVVSNNLIWDFNLPAYHLISDYGHHHEQTYIFVMLISFWIVILFTAFIASSMMKRYRIVRDKLLNRQIKLIDEDKTKLQFFRFVTHELKSPISTVQSAIDTVLEVSKDELNKSSTNLLYRSRNRTQQMIDTVKDLSEITQGAIPKVIEVVKIDVKKAIQNIADNEMVQNDKNIELDFVFPDNPLLINTYPNYLEKIIINLISNAIRYNSENGKIIVSLSSGKDSFTLSVEDTGIGISKADQEKIFDEFYRSAEAKKVSRIGTGLGMSIVKRFVDKLGGKITIDSQLNVGTKFTVELPLHVR